MFGVNDTDGERVYLDSVKVFEQMTNMMPLEETGLYFHDEVEVGNGVSVITDERVSLGSPENTAKTYHKVVEVVELNELEMQEANKARLLLKKLFEVFFKGKKGLVIYTMFIGLCIGLDIATKDWFGLLLNISLIFLWDSPIKFAKEVKKIFTSSKKREELSEELKELGISSTLQNVSSKDSVQLYYKPRIGR